MPEKEASPGRAFKLKKPPDRARKKQKALLRATIDKQRRELAAIYGHCPRQKTKKTSGGPERAGKRKAVTGREPAVSNKKRKQKESYLDGDFEDDDLTGLTGLSQQDELHRLRLENAKLKGREAFSRRRLSVSRTPTGM